MPASASPHALMNAAPVAPSPRRDARSRIVRLREAVDRRLAALAPPEHAGDRLPGAIRHALLAPGKRIRPLLVLLAAEELGQTDLRTLDAACALEMVHAASLVLDDLPVMDDSPTRRGRPSTHVLYGEDVAILSAVSLLALAFGTVSGCERLEAAARGRIVGSLAAAIGPDGLSGGQYADLARAAGKRPVDHVLRTNGQKTGALFVAAVEIAAATARPGAADAEPLRSFAEHLGQAFQILDDLQDAIPAGEGPAEDEGRPTLVALVGRAEAAQRLAAHLGRALDGLRPEGDLAAYVRAIFEGARAPSAT